MSSKQLRTDCGGMGEVWRAYAALKRAVKRLDNIAKDGQEQIQKVVKDA